MNDHGYLLNSTIIVFISQDIHEAISMRMPDNINLVDTSGEVFSMEYIGLVCILWGALKELQDRVGALEARV